MKRASAIVLTLLFALQAVGVGSVCCCVKADNPEPAMAADHSCCRAAAKAYESDDNDTAAALSDEFVAGDREGCRCGVEVAALSSAQHDISRRDSAVTAAVVGGASPGSKVVRHVDRARAPPPARPHPPPVPHLSRLQVWRC